MSYINPTSLMAMAVCFLNIPTLLLMLRFVVRRLQKFALGLDDWLILPAWFLLVASCVDIIAGVAYGRLGVSLGTRNPWGPNPELDETEQFAWAQFILLPATLAFAKLSVLFFYRRMLCPESLGPFHKLTRAIIVITGLWGLVYTLLYVFQCGGSFTLIWAPTPSSSSSGQCLSGQLDASFTLTDTLLDLVILVLPIRKILSLRLPSAKKLSILAAFGVGALTTSISLVRAVIVLTQLAGNLSPLSTADEALAASTMAYWALFEAGTAVVVACLPSLQYLFRRALPEHIKRSAAAASAAGSGTQSSPSRLKSVDVLEKASVMTQSTMGSRRPSLSSIVAGGGGAHAGLPVFASRPGTPGMVDYCPPPPLPETFSGFSSRSATLTSSTERPEYELSSGTATPVTGTSSHFHKRTPSLFRQRDGYEGDASPVSTTSTMDSRAPLWGHKPSRGY